MKKLIGIIIISLIYCNPSFSDGHKTKFKDIKGFKKQFISMSEKKINRIVFSSNQTLIWDTIRSVGYKSSIEGYGKLLRN